MNVKSGSFDTHFTYTDQERDDESGLMYYGARYYHHILGRFTQPDPSIFSLNTQTLANPQLLNPYSYSLNNPLRYTDPDGKNPAETVGGWGVGIAEGLGNTAIWLFQKTTHPIRSTQEAGNMVSKAGDEVFSILQNPGIAVREAGQGYGIQAKELGEWYLNASDYERGKVLGQITEKVAEGYVVGKVAGKVAGKLNNADDAISASTPVGRKGQPIKVAPSNKAKVINGRPYSGHALDRMQEHGITPSVIENTMKHGTVGPGNTAGTSAYYDPNNNFSVIVNNETGNIITTGYGKK